MDFMLIAAGLALLLAGGEALVRGSVALARRFGVSPLVIGVTVVGLGTSAPELVVGVNAALRGASGIMVGNVIGSNMANMMLILGTAAVIRTMPVNRDALRRDSTAMAAATVLFAAVALGGEAGPYQGLAMVCALAAFVGISLWLDIATESAATALHQRSEKQSDRVPARIWTMAAAVVIGIALLIAGAELLVRGAVTLARSVGISEEVIGLTLVAVGTSLPELATSIVAAVRRQPDVCLGNVLGSNIFNLLGITGVAAMVAPIAFHQKILSVDLWALVAVSALLIVVMLTGRRISRLEGAVLLALYAAYVAGQFFGLGAVAPSAPS